LTWNTAMIRRGSSLEETPGSGTHDGIIVAL
jgi:hypothetical protein